ncbi:MAG: hypothetical protein ABGY41_21790 [Candidatus Poribacteria bacterium]
MTITVPCSDADYVRDTIQRLLDGASPDEIGIQHAQLGQFSDVIDEMCRAFDDGGSEAVEATFAVAVQQDQQLASFLSLPIASEPKTVCDYSAPGHG